MSENKIKELQSMQTAIDEGREREAVAANILADKRKECERSEKERQELKEKAVEAFKDIMSDVMMESRDGKFVSEDYYLTKFSTHLNK